MNVNAWQFNFFEVLAVLGLSHCVFALVYLFFRSGNLRQAIIVITFFSVLGLAFLGNFAGAYYSEFYLYPLISNFIWLTLPVVSTLLVIQVSRIEEVPEFKYWLVLSFIPAIAIVGWVLGSFQHYCDLKSFCDLQTRISALQIAGIVFGGFALLTLWAGRDDLMKVYQQKLSGRERYWLIIALILINILLLGALLLVVSEVISIAETPFIFTALGLAMVYLASTSVFRIYPQALSLTKKPPSSLLGLALTDENQKLIEKIENLINMDKVYQEAAYSRTELARELGISEANTSKIVNQHFGKTVPQMLNEKRVEDACHFLKNTDMTVASVSEESGFSSLPSFNRVFKELTGKSPTEFRRDSRVKA